MSEKANGAPSRSRISDADHGVAPELARTKPVDNASGINGDARAVRFENAFLLANQYYARWTDGSVMSWDAYVRNGMMKESV